MRILHIVPDSVVDAKDHFLGSTKDALGRIEYFESRQMDVDRIVVRGRSDSFLLARLKELDLARYSAAILELPLYPRSLQYLGKQAPHIVRIVRPINAEFYHQLHKLRLVSAAMVNRTRTASSLNVLRTLRRAVWRLVLDFLCARRADVVLSITNWEKDRYWRYLAGASKVCVVPYFLPKAYLDQIAPAAKSLQCVCLMSSSANEFLDDSLRRFTHMVKGLGERFGEWSFVVTGELSTLADAPPLRIRFTGLLETPFPLLAESRAVALLSPFGFGFKTKIIDAIMNTCHLLIPRELLLRLPDEIKGFCIEVNPASPASLEHALDKCTGPYPEGNPNEVLRRQAFAALDSVLLERRGI